MNLSPTSFLRHFRHLGAPHIKCMLKAETPFAPLAGTAAGLSNCLNFPRSPALTIPMTSDSLSRLKWTSISKGRNSDE